MKDIPIGGSGQIDFMMGGFKMGGAGLLGTYSRIYRGIVTRVDESNFTFSGTSEYFDRYDFNNGFSRGVEPGIKTFGGSLYPGKGFKIKSLPFDYGSGRFQNPIPFSFPFVFPLFDRPPRP